MIFIVLPWSCTWRGGVSTVVRSLDQEWSFGCVPHRIVVDDWTARRPEQRGLEWHFRFTALASLRIGSIIRGVPGGSLALFRLWRHLRSSGCTAVNLHYPGLNALGLALLKCCGAWRGQLVLSFHGTDVRAPQGRIEEWAWRSIFKQCDSITACSQSLLNRLSITMAAPMGKASVIYNGVDSVLFRPSRDEELKTMSQDSSEQEAVLSIGAYHPRKGHRFLLEAIAHLKQSRPKLVLIVAGLDGVERSRLERLAVDLGLAERVEFKCNIEPAAVAELIRGACLVVQPSLEESFGLAVIEAGACGIPVAVSAVGGHLEIVTDGETGWVFAPGDSVACAEAIDLALTAKDEAAERAARLHKEILLRFTWHRCATEYLGLLRDVKD